MNTENRSPGTPLALSSFLRELSLEFLLLTGCLLVLPLCLWLMSSLMLLSALVIIISLWAMQSLAGVFNFRQLSIPAFFYVLYVCMILVPGFFIFRDEVVASRGRFLFGVESVMLTVPLGIWFANLFLNFHRREIADFFAQPILADPAGAHAKRTYLIVLSLSLLLVLINLKETPVIPLLFLIRNPGDFMTAALLREDSFKLLNSNFTYAYYVLRGTIFPFLIMVAFGRYWQRGKSTWKALFWTTLILGIGYASITIEKSPVAAVLGLLGLFYYLLKGGRLGKVGAMLVPALFVSFPLIVILLAYQGTDSGTLTGALQAISERIFYSPAQVVFAYFEVFPAVIPFQHGASLIKLAHVMGWNTVDIPNAVGLYMAGGGIDTISANSCFIGNFNADFGLPGVIVGGVLAGFSIQAVNIYLCRQAKTLVNLAAYAICMWACGMLVSSALSTQMLSGGVAFAIALAWLFKDKTRESLPPARGLTFSSQ